MRKLYLGMVVLALAAVPAVLSAQEHQGMGRGMGMGMGMGMMRNPASMVLEHQSELGLTPAQLEKLGKIRDKFDEENGETLKKLDKEHDEIVKKYGQGPYTEEQREQIRKDRHESREEMQKFGANVRKAREEIREVLTPTQYSRLRDIMPMRGERMGGPADER